jgi:hypothetical protein
MAVSVAAPVLPGAFLLELIPLPVMDIDWAKAFYIGRGIEVAAAEGLGGGYCAAFSDPGGNTWTLQHLPWRK